MSGIPGGIALNDALQKTIGGLSNFEANIDMKVIQDWLVFMRHLKNLNIDPQGLDYFEVGTGWYPTLPFCFSLAGARRVLTYDLNRHVRPNWTFRMLQCLEKHLPAIAAASNRPIEDVWRDYRKLRLETKLNTLLAAARIEYRAPADAGSTGLPDGCTDVVYSNSVLEHVLAADIPRLMREARRLLRLNGIAIHSANCGDHYAYFDRDITAINYLAYSDGAWAFWQNRLLYQNRLRPEDFARIATQAGFIMRHCYFTPKQHLIDALPSIRIAPEFQHYSPEQVCSTSVDLLLDRGSNGNYESFDR
ncbi:MAG: class I SAM-dependent methyltransferase [Acidobacteriia bacterium]|nr:class I SAM-dependent methyltransferase [Terriglobia bacterium]